MARNSDIENNYYRAFEVAPIVGIVRAQENPRSAKYELRQ